MNPSNFTKASFFVTRLTIQLKQRPIITAKPWHSDFPSRQIAPSFDILGSVLSPLFALNTRSRLLKIAQYLCFYWKTENKPYATNTRDAGFKVNVNARRLFKKVEAEPREKEFNKRGGWNIIRRLLIFMLLCGMWRCKSIPCTKRVNKISNRDENVKKIRKMSSINCGSLCFCEGKSVWNARNT